ncbi:hypothetical protein ACQ4PT_038357 [Festuca glaucescens]
MDLITLTATIAVLFLTMIIFRKFVASTRETASPQPPVVGGGYLLTAMHTLRTKGLQPVLYDLYTKLGSVFTINIFGLKKVTFLIGPEITAHFFQGSQSEICLSDMYKLTVPIFGKGLFLDADFATYMKQIKVCRDVVKSAHMKSHVDSMVREVEDYFAKWGQEGIVDLKHELGQVILMITARCFLGKEIRREEDKVGGKFAYTSFSGGRHVCAGEEFAFMQIQVIWSCLLRNFELKMISPFPEEEYDKLIPGPKGNVMVGYKKRLLQVSP